MLKYLSKFAMDILPSVVATIIGAYIVNHYIVTKPAADAPVAAAVSSVDPEKGRCARPMQAGRESADVANIPEAGRQGQGHLRKGDDREDRPPKSRVPRKSSAEKPPKPTSRRRPPASRPRRAGIACAARKGDRAKVRADSAGRLPRRSGRRRAEYRAGRGRRGPGRAPRRQRSGARRDRTPAWHRRRFAARARKPRASPMRRASRQRRSCCARVVSAPPVRPLPPPIMVSTPAGRDVRFAGSSQRSLTRPPRGPTIRAVRRRRPIFRTSRPLDLRAEAADRPRANTPRLPRTCCRRRNRCFTRCCRNSPAN